MSVINRMLSDLERRGGHTASGAPAMRVARPVARRRWPDGRHARLLLAVALVAVASTLWIQRGPAIGEQIRLASTDRQDDSERIADTPEQAVAADGSGATAATGEATPPLVAAADPLQSTLADLHFETGADGAASLVLTFAGEPPPVSLPPTEQETIILRLLATASDVAVPAPPGDQAAFRSISVVPQGPTTELRLVLVDGVRIGLERGGDASLRLTARIPTEPVARADAAAEAAVADPASESSEADDETGTGADANGAAATASAVGSGAIELAAEAAGGIRSEETAGPEVRARRRYAEARDALAAGDVRRARHRLEEAVELDPDLHSAREILVALLRRAGDTAAAREVLAEGVARAPARPAYAMTYARLLVDADRLDTARDVLEAARINAEGELDFHALAANIHRRLGDHRAAIAEYTAALEIDSRQASLWLGLGISLAAEAHDEQARAAFREALDTGRLSGDLERWAERRMEELARSRGGN